jgi:two-component system NarL family sensor kinase
MSESLRLSDELEVAIFRIVQECLTNIHRHSGGKTATIRLARDMSSVSLQIRDDGAGMAKDTLTAIRTQRSGVGITGMRERVRHLGGTLDIQSDSSGTIVLATLPVAKQSIADVPIPDPDSTKNCINTSGAPEGSAAQAGLQNLRGLSGAS